MDTVTLKGKIVFDPDHKTRKHEAQGSWKRVAMVYLSGNICEYYAWFIKKRYNLPLTKPLRGAHISFINDRENQTNGKWDEVKKRWHNKRIEVVLSVDPRTDASHWWLVVPEDERKLLHGIRAELGLGRPFYGLHMSIGYAKDEHDERHNETNGQVAKRMNVAHSQYIHDLLKKGLIT